MLAGTAQVSGVPHFSIHPRIALGHLEIRLKLTTDANSFQARYLLPICNFFFSHRECQNLPRMTVAPFARFWFTGCGLGCIPGCLRGRAGCDRLSRKGTEGSGRCVCRLSLGS